MFDRSVVISLARRRDRLEAFYGRLPSDWDLGPVQAVEAVDGSQERPPAWWRTTPGAWGCFLSHRAVIRAALDDGVERLLVFEDDCAFARNFQARVSGTPIPEDCQQLYFGGQHLGGLERGPPGLVIGRNVNRTHAYAVFGRPALEILAAHLEPEPEIWKARHHVDHHYGVLHRERRIRVYAFSPWVCGQAEGTSDVRGRAERERWWRA
jgi:hypothetical protein